ncbi:MAG: DDE-type integrase/transposase/recombinase [Paracoccaceae bacterium]
MARLRSNGVRTSNRKAALDSFWNLMNQDGRPETTATDRSRFYRGALKDLGRSGGSEMRRWLNNGAERPHLPVRREERPMMQVRRMQWLQTSASIQSHLWMQRRHQDRNIFRQTRAAALAEWRCPLTS